MLVGLYFVFGLWLISGVSAWPTLPIHGDNRESQFLHNLTKQMASRNKVDSLALFGVNREMQRSKHILVESLEECLTEAFQKPIVVWGLRRNITLRRILGERTLVCVSISNVSPKEEPIFDVLTDGLFGLHHVPILFIYKRLESQPPTMDQLKDMFSWCWRQKFINVFVTYQQISFTNTSAGRNVSWENYLYTYTAFPEVTVRNLTQTGYQHTDIMMDFRGYEFRVPVFQDAPSAFWLSDGRLSGTFGLMFAAYVHHRRGRYRLEPAVDVDRYNYHENLMLAAARGEIEIGVHPYSSMQPGAERTAGFFPLAPTNTCVLVPWQHEPPPGRFIRYAVRINGTFLLVLLLAMTLAWQLARGEGLRGIQLSLVTFFLQPISDTNFRRLAEPYKFIHVAALLGSFVLWTMRTANLSSVFTSQVCWYQVDSVKDFLATPLRLMLTESEVEMYFTAGNLPVALRQRLQVVNRSTLVEHLDQLNTSYAYCTTTEHWSVVQMQQERLESPRFRLASRICTGTHILRYPMQWNSPFQRNFFRFSSLAKQSGFWSYWSGKGQRDAIRMGLVVKMMDDHIPIHVLNLKDFELLLKIYILSLTGCLLCLLGEIAWLRYWRARMGAGS
ncbi:hypothetical protein KR026_001836 [Drosophila bipectinata]|nr:hypothetical protein KR026_001836 [Drosophila bipectinata]